MTPRALARTLANSWSAILFLPRPWAAVALLPVTFLRPWAGLAGLLAVAGGLGTAAALGYRRDAVEDGLYGCNALLIGLAIGMSQPFTAVLAVQAVVAGAAAACLTAVLSDALWRGLGVPAFVMPFALLAAAFAPLSTSLAAARIDPAVLPPEILSPEWLPSPASGLLSALGAIFYQPFPLAGALVLATAAAVSRIGAAALLAGALAGGLAATAVGGPSEALLVSRYNGALTAAALAAFLHVPGRTALLAGLLAAGTAGWLSTTLQPLFEQVRLPITAWPFLLTTLTAARALRLRAPDRPPFPTVLAGQTPEANFEYACTLARRFQTPGPPAFFLPVRGDWAVTQGVDGEHTHRGAWAHAWDFEILDPKGFPFRGDGAHLEDYPAFGGAVHAPGAGVVETVQDGMKDGDPGTLDSARGWGNHVVLRHGPELFTILAHLRRGSVTVRPGQPVAAGDLLAQVGSSGRAPRPHLHFQAQRTAQAGAAAVPCRITHYLEVPASGPPHYVFSGIPAEGTRLRTLSPAPIAAAFAALTPGSEFAFDLEDGARLRLRSEITLSGERSLVDLDRAHRLWFSLAWGDIAFTTCAAPRGSPLWALFVALPRLPIAAPPHTFRDEPPAGALLPAPLAHLHGLVRLVADPVRTTTDASVRERDGCVVVESRTDAGVAGRSLASFCGRVEIDADGLRGFELRDALPGGRLHCAARRPDRSPLPSNPVPIPREIAS